MQEDFEIPQARKYLDLRIDWAFKYVFSKKEILLKLLNDILPPTITDLSYIPNEIPVMSEKDKRSTLDVICSGPEGKFLVEMQRRHTVDVDDRLAYYSATLIQRQVKRKDPTYKVKHVYVLNIVSYIRPHSSETPDGKILFSYDQRENETYELLRNSKASFYYLELSRMKERDWEKLHKNPERWCYLFKNMSNFADESDVPVDLHGFEEVLDAARVDSLSPEDMERYNDMVAAIENERRSADLFHYNRGKEDGKEEAARAMLADNMPIESIVKYTGLTPEEIAAL